MENKKILLLLLIIIILFCALGIVYKLGKEEQNVDKVSFESKILDNKSFEEKSKEIAASSTEEKISPNAILIKEITYLKCNHTTREVIDIPKELVNLTKEQLEELMQEKYKDWILKEYSSTEITMYKKEDGECDEHFIIRAENGIVNVYRKYNGLEEKYFETSIHIDYFPEQDQQKLIDGISAVGKQKMQAIIEDYE